MICEYCGKTPEPSFNRTCEICGRVRCSPECHWALMDIDERAELNRKEQK